MSCPDVPFPQADIGSLIDRAHAGDTAARQELLEHCREPLLARIRWMMGDEARRVAESSDFLQSTIVAVLEALPRFEDRGGDALLRWMTTIARNKIRGAVRRPRETALSMLSTSLGGVPSTDGSQEQLSVDTALTLRDAFTRLSVDERRLIELHDFEGLSFADIGTRLACSERHAHRLHAQALLRLGRAFRGGAA